MIYKLTTGLNKDNNESESERDFPNKRLNQITEIEKQNTERIKSNIILNESNNENNALNAIKNKDPNSSSPKIIIKVAPNEIENINNNIDNNEENIIEKENNKNEENLIIKILHSPLEAQIEPQIKINPGNINLVFTRSHNKNYEVLESNILVNDPQDMYSIEYISRLNYKEIEYDTFCHCFFVSGLKYDNKEIIKESEEYPSTCLHKECSILSSFQPSVIQFYQNKNKTSQIDISDLTANLVFPLGIKLCFNNNDYNTDNNYPKPYNTFLNVIRNEKGEIYYIVSYHYFRKMDINEFDKKYKINPLKEYTKFQNINDKDEKFDVLKFQKNLDIVSKFIGCEVILIPECITLVSRFPFINQMKECLEIMIQLNEDDLNNLVNHLTNEIPIPYKNQRLLFYIPYNTKAIELVSPFKPSMVNCITCNILKYLSIENIIKIYHLTLLEQKILFIDNDYQLLSNISFAFINLIYPFFWSDIYVPVLSLSSVRFLQSIIPFIMGTDEFLFKYSLNNDYIDRKNENNIVFVDIRHDEITLNTEHILKKKFSWKKDIIKVLKIPKLPNDIEKYLTKKLKELKNININNVYIVERKIREIFMRAFIMMFGNMQIFTFIKDNDMPIFNTEFFLLSKKNDEKPFYKEIFQTQNFAQFLFSENEIIIKNIQHEKVPLNEPYGKKFDNLVFDTSSFNKMSIKYIKENDNVLIYSNKNKSSVKKKNQNRQMSRKTTVQSNKNEGENIQTDLSEYSNNKKKNSFSNENNDSHYSNTEYTKVIPTLLSPYFLQMKNESFDREKIEVNIQNEINKKEALKTNEEKKLPDYIVINSKRNYNLNKVNDIYRRYFFNMTIKLDIETERLSRFSVRKTLSKPLPNPEYLEEIKLIQEWFNKICSIEFEKELNPVEEISHLMKKKENREYFTNLIFQGLPQNTLFKKALSNKSFVELLKIIKCCLIFISNEESEYHIGKLLTMCCFSYFTYEKNYKIKYIYEDKFFPSCKIWEIKNFWKEWYSENYHYDDGTLSNDSDNEEENNDDLDNEIKILINMFIIMSYLELDDDFINDVIMNDIASEYLSEEQIEVLEDEISSLEDDDVQLK